MLGSDRDAPMVRPSSNASFGQTVAIAVLSLLVGAATAVAVMLRVG